MKITAKLRLLVQLLSLLGLVNHAHANHAHAQTEKPTFQSAIDFLQNLSFRIQVGKFEEYVLETPWLIERARSKGFEYTYKIGSCEMLLIADELKNIYAYEIPVAETCPFTIALDSGLAFVSGETSVKDIFNSNKDKCYQFRIEHSFYCEFMKGCGSIHKGISAEAHLQMTLAHYGPYGPLCHNTLPARFDIVVKYSFSLDSGSAVSDWLEDNVPEEVKESADPEGNVILLDNELSLGASLSDSAINVFGSERPNKITVYILS